ncbi:MAG: SDR family NAD(P)-dependent oxidoreductase [Promethearchaeia archaeon]
MESLFLRDKTTLITGAASGFGRKMAITFAKKGSDLVLIDINMEGLEETKKLVLKESSVNVILKKCDISKSNEVKQTAKDVLNEVDNIYVLINNAGVDGGLYKSLMAPEENYDLVMNVNVKGAWNMTKVFSRKMKRQKDFKPIQGKIINIASCAGTQCGLNPFIGIYSASKAALIAFTKLWALELGSNNITVNAISPGLFITPMYKDDPTLMRKFMEMRGVKLPIDRFGQPEEVANIALFLASPLADYITGQNIILDGGMTISINKM